MAKKDLFNDVKQFTIATNVAINSNTSTDFNALSTENFLANLFLVTGNTITDGTYEIVLIEGDTITAGLIDNPVLVSAEDSMNKLPSIILSTDDGKTARLGYRGTKKYIAIRIISTGVTAGGAFNILGINGVPNYAPTSEELA